MKKKILFTFLILTIFFLSDNLWPRELKEAILVHPETNRKVSVVADEILVRFKPGVKKETIDKINKKFGVKIKKKLRIKNVYRLKIPPSKTIDEMLEKYRKNPNVESAQPNYIGRLFKIPNDYDSNEQWGIGQIRAPEAWNKETGKDSIVIAILDTGVEYDHEDLEGNMWDDGSDHCGYDFVNEDPYPYDDHEDSLGGHSHGTHCAGIAAAVTDNATGIVGVSWESLIMAVKIFDANGGLMTTSDVVEGIDYAVDNGANIISMSFGISPSDEDRRAIEKAYNRGCLLVAASGNEELPYVAYPARHDYVIAVGATNEGDERCDVSDWGYDPWGNPQGSNYGPRLEVVAPGNHIKSTVRAVKGIYGDSSGTSMSVPFVAGLAALIWSHNPGLENSDVRDIIRSSADDIGSSGWDKYTGYGRINAEQALALATPLEKEIVYKIMNFPNPFRPAEISQTTICFTTKESVTERNIGIYNLAGELVRKAPETGIFLDGIDPEDRHVYKYKWDGKNDYGERVASGIYIFVVNADGNKKAGKLAVIK